MLELRPNCEGCDKNLPASSKEACICSYECTFCSNCVENILSNVCPNCGGNFSPRPIRPQSEYRSGVSLKKQAASTKRINTQYTEKEITGFCNTIKDIKPRNR